MKILGEKRPDVLRAGSFLKVPNGIKTSEKGLSRIETMKRVLAKSEGKADIYNGGLHIISHWWKSSFNNHGPTKLSNYKAGSKRQGYWK